MKKGVERTLDFETFFPASSTSFRRFTAAFMTMARPNCQTTGSPKKTPQSTPSKALSSGIEAADGNPVTPEEGQAAATTGGSPALNFPQVIPVMEKFGCLRIYRLSSLLLSMHC